MDNQLNDLLTNIHKSLAEELLARIQSGEATAAELAAAIKFLKDNGIDASAQKSEPLINLARVLPFDPEAPVEEAG
ncbi:MAG: hypothetical protein Unbinned7358contig1001_5 [Prokaryotic dsDNA virus sp.]|nr:MAG: hypothetical protein Unbinned7358contig1001_5 [Prokaryotic dsDNA virus sp.]|tara:strand:+ start:4151 stop:4378 length:228 start_codon:yes stop_codon:yes gene_type:complete